MGLEVALTVILLGSANGARRMPRALSERHMGDLERFTDHQGAGWLARCDLRRRFCARSAICLISHICPTCPARATHDSVSALITLPPPNRSSGISMSSARILLRFCTRASCSAAQANTIGTSATLGRWPSLYLIREAKPGLRLLLRAGLKPSNMSGPVIQT